MATNMRVHAKVIGYQLMLMGFVIDDGSGTKGTRKSNFSLPTFSRPSEPIGIAVMEKIRPGDNANDDTIEMMYLEIYNPDGGYNDIPESLWEAAIEGVRDAGYKTSRRSPGQVISIYRPDWDK